MHITLLRRDDGFSLSEMLVVLALLGLVLSGAWSLFYLTNVGVTQSNQQAWISREIGQPLERMERSFSQKAIMSDPAAYTCVIRTDADRDDFFEVHQYQATTDGKLIELYYEENGIPAYVYTPETRKISDHNSNRATNTPLFTYFDEDGTQIIPNGTSTMSVQISQYATSVVMTIVTEHDGKQYADSRQVYFRNK